VSASAHPPCGQDLLAALVSDEALASNGLTVSELASATSRDRGLVARIAADMVELGFVETDSRTRRMRLSWRLFVNAARIGQGRLVRRGEPLLRELSDALGESAYVVVRFGTQAVTVAEATPPGLVVVASWVGRSWPVGRSDAGPVLLSELTPDEIRALIGDELPPTRAANAPHRIGGLLELVEVARRTGVSILDEQADEDVASVAAPVLDHRERLVAGIVVSGPSVRFRLRLEDAARVVAEAAATLSAELGAPRYGARATVAPEVA
jgi:IclR family transcriptional regulator, pca regulon regulatory protein